MKTRLNRQIVNDARMHENFEKSAKNRVNTQMKKIKNIFYRSLAERSPFI
jgi:hypothetical protein